MTLSEFVLVTVIELVSATVQASAGFGLNIVAVPLLSLVSSKFIPGPVLVAGLVISLMVGYRDRDSIDWASVKWIVVGRLPGTLVGAIAVASLPARRTTLMIAGLVLLSVGMSLLGLKVARIAWNLVGLGSVSGIMSTVAGLGGTPLALLYQHDSGPSVRASLSLNASIGCAMSLGVLEAAGECDTGQIAAGLALLPGVAIGYLLARPVAKYLDQGRMRPAVLALCVLAAFVVLGRSIF